MIPFNKPVKNPNSIKYINLAIQRMHISGDGYYTSKCSKWIEDTLNCRKALITTSCTHSLEMAALLLNIQAGDEVIMPSYTFVSTANAFVLRGAKINFIDINPNTMNLDENQIEHAISEKTKAIVVVHYAGICCNMDKVINIARKYNIFVVEDAAQAILSKYKNRFAGTLGDIGCFSFHETKNISCGEGGAILLNNENFIEQAEIIREKGTNRTKFLNGEIDKYTWVGLGSSYLLSDISAGYLYAQLEQSNEITMKRRYLWNLYYQKLLSLKDKNLIELPYVPDYCHHNAHLFYVKTENKIKRDLLIRELRKNRVYGVFHYIPLHSSKSGIKFGEFVGKDQYTTKDSERLLRLPLFYDLTEKDVDYICYIIKNFYCTIEKN